jgi:hypothetical protein
MTISLFLSFQEQLQVPLKFGLQLKVQILSLSKNKLTISCLTWASTNLYAMAKASYPNFPCILSQ